LVSHPSTAVGKGYPTYQSQKVNEFKGSSFVFGIPFAMDGITAVLLDPRMLAASPPTPILEGFLGPQGGKMCRFYMAGFPSTRGGMG